MRKFTSILLTTCMILMSVATTARAGGALETIDITAGAPSPIPGHILARVIGIRWDSRSIEVAITRPTTPTTMFIRQPCRAFVPISMLATQPASAPKTTHEITPIATPPFHCLIDMLRCRSYHASEMTITAPVLLRRMNAGFSVYEAKMIR